MRELNIFGGLLT
jgi:hypothetical protein